MKAFVLLLAVLPMAGCYSHERLVDCADATELDDVVELCDLSLELRPAEDVMVVTEGGRRPFGWSNVFVSGHQSDAIDRRLCFALNVDANATQDRCVAMSGWVDAEERISLDRASTQPIELGDRISFCTDGDATKPIRVGVGLEYTEAEGAGQKTYRGFTHGDLGPIPSC